MSIRCHDRRAGPDPGAVVLLCSLVGRARAIDMAWYDLPAYNSQSYNTEIAAHGTCSVPVDCFAKTPLSDAVS